jgi:cobaltochelatase CobS
MVSYANEVRGLFMGARSNGADTVLEVTFSTRTLIRWANLTVKFQPLAWQGLSPINYALDRALAFRASPESRVFLHELSQRFFANDANIQVD